MPDIKAEFKVRGVYGRPWSKMAGGIPLTRNILNQLGKTMIKEVVKEARKDFAMQGRKPTPRGEPEGIPKSRDFFRSFRHKVRGTSTVEIYSTWPWIEQILEGRDPYKMPWLTQAKGVYRVPMRQPGGIVLIRMTPATTRKAWVHPGFAKHKFVERGVESGRDKAAKLLAAHALRVLAEGNPFK